MYLEKNIALNRVSNRVFPIHGDAMKAAPTILRGLIDRVIMNLPEKALSFVSAACQAIKQEGGVIHYYAFKDEPGSVRKAELELRTAVEEAERKVLRVKFARPVREIAPRRWQVVVDAVIY
jgi:tRNA (guanine37-N1)-methyltransferase